MNLGKMGVNYIKPVKATQSGSQAGSASHTSGPSASGAGDQEVDSQAGPSSTRAPRVSAAQKALAEELKDEHLFRLSDPLMAPIREECAAAFNTQNERIQGLETRLARMEGKLDLLLHHFLSPPQPPPNQPPPNHPHPPPSPVSAPPPPPGAAASTPTNTLTSLSTEYGAATSGEHITLHYITLHHITSLLFCLLTHKPVLDFESC